MNLQANHHLIILFDSRSPLSLSRKLPFCADAFCFSYLFAFGAVAAAFCFSLSLHNPGFLYARICSKTAACTKQRLFLKIIPIICIPIGSPALLVLQGIARAVKPGLSLPNRILITRHTSVIGFFKTPHFRCRGRSHRC